jgi:hypothetical protein
MTKTDIPKTEIPKTALPPSYDAWVNAARENLQRYQTAVNTYWDEVASFENAMYERARAATADLAGLAAESIAYVAALSAEWRKMSLDATRKMTDAFKA